MHVSVIFAKFASAAIHPALLSETITKSFRNGNHVFLSPNTTPKTSISFLLSKPMLRNLESIALHMRSEHDFVVELGRPLRDRGWDMQRSVVASIYELVTINNSRSISG